MLIFQVKEQLYAVNAETIQEVITPVPVTPLPFVSQMIEGLINIAGRVVPQINTVFRLGLAPEQDASNDTLIVLNTNNKTCACRVKRVIAKISVAPEEITLSSPDGSETTDVLFKGEFPWNDQLIVMLDPAQLMFEAGNSIFDQNNDDTGLVAEVTQGRGIAQATIHEEEFPCILFICNNELFAFRFDDVLEVIESNQPTQLPGVPPEMPGMLLLRGHPLPLLSMQALLFGGIAAENAPYTMIVDLNGYKVGLQVERVVGIQRFPEASLRPMLEEQSLLEGFVTTQDNRMVGVIRFAAFSSEEFLETWRPFFTAQEKNNTDNQEQESNAQHFLMFQLGTETMAVPLSTVERIEENSAVTQTPGCDNSMMSGIIQVQGNITPIIHLDKMLGLVAGPSSVCLIIRENDIRIAVPVDKVDKVIKLREMDIDPVRAEGHTVLSGVGKYQGTLVSLINVEKLLSL